MLIGALDINTNPLGRFIAVTQRGEVDRLRDVLHDASFRAQLKRVAWRSSAAMFWFSCLSAILRFLLDRSLREGREIYLAEASTPVDFE